LYKTPTSLNLTAITTDVLGSTWGKLFLADCALAIFVCCLAIHAMSVRILFAMGRDNNLPMGQRWSSVSKTRRVPVFPAVFVGVVSALILAFNIYNPYAFTIIISLGIIWMYLAYLGVTIPLLQRRLAGWPDNASSNRPGLFSLGGLGVITNVIAIVYGAAMAVNLSWPRDYYYGPKFYQQYGPILGVAAVVIVGLVLYYGYQQTRMEVLPEHRADQNVPLSVAMGEPPPIHGGP
jgi:amino acid transporter